MQIRIMSENDNLVIEGDRRVIRLISDLGNMIALLKEGKTREAEIKSQSAMGYVLNIYFEPNQSDAN